MDRLLPETPFAAHRKKHTRNVAEAVAVDGAVVEDGDVEEAGIAAVGGGVVE